MTCLLYFGCVKSEWICLLRLPVYHEQDHDKLHLELFAGLVGMGRGNNQVSFPLLPYASISDSFIYHVRYSSKVSLSTVFF